MSFIGMNCENMAPIHIETSDLDPQWSKELIPACFMLSYGGNELRVLFLGLNHQVKPPRRPMSVKIRALRVYHAWEGQIYGSKEHI